MGKSRQTGKLSSDGIFYPDITNSRVGIGTTIPTETLDIRGSLRLTGGLYDTNNDIGSDGKILVSTGVGVSWTTSAGYGSTGSQGVQGVQGGLSAQGLQGNAGYVGADGSQGTQGLQGDQGTQGLQGLSNQGSQGVQGDQGTQGLQGVQGDQGTQGLQGLQGVQGDQGTQGVQGLRGSDGTSVTIKGSLALTPGTEQTQLNDSGNSWYPPQSGDGVIDSNTGNLWVYNGSTWNNVGSVRGPQGTQGLQGNQGNQGIQGLQGLQGTQGLQGVQGDQGTQGLQGLQGNQGIQGLQGIQGIQGLQGNQGIQGIQGLQGLQGTSIQGVQGPAGSAGGGGGSITIKDESSVLGTAVTSINFVGSGVVATGNNTEVTVTISGGGGGGSNPWTRKTANYTAVAGDQLIADTTSGTFTITLPSSPSPGDSIRIADGGDWVTNNLIVDRNGSNIEGDVNNFTLDIRGIVVEFVYEDATDGWQVYAHTGPGAIGGTGDILEVMLFG